MQNGHQFQIIRGAQFVDITDLVNYGLVEFDGFGMPDVRRLTQRGPLQNGDTDVGFRLDPRIMRLAVIAYAGSEQGIIDKRAALLGLLRPGNGGLILRWTYDGVSKQIDCHYAGGMTLPSTDWRLSHHRAVFELRAADPTWYMTETSTVTWARDAGGAGFVFPLSTPIAYGASIIDANESVILNSDNAWETFPFIYIYGRINDPVVTNLTTGNVLDFTGSNVGAGEYIAIDLSYGTKTVILVSGVTSTNWVSKLSPSSALATFSLQPGENTVKLTGSNADSTTRVEMLYNERLIGV